MGPSGHFRFTTNKTKHRCTETKENKVFQGIVIKEIFVLRKPLNDGLPLCFLYPSWRNITFSVKNQRFFILFFFFMVVLFLCWIGVYVRGGGVRMMNELMLLNSCSVFIKCR